VAVIPRRAGGGSHTDTARLCWSKDLHENRTQNNSPSSRARAKHVSDGVMMKKSQDVNGRTNEQAALVMHHSSLPRAASAAQIGLSEHAALSVLFIRDRERASTVCVSSGNKTTSSLQRVGDIPRYIPPMALQSAKSSSAPTIPGSEAGSFRLRHATSLRAVRQSAAQACVSCYQWAINGSITYVSIHVPGRSFFDSARERESWKRLSIMTCRCYRAALL
jgi:hypothetical protein